MYGIETHGDEDRHPNATPLYISISKDRLDLLTLRAECAMAFEAENVRLRNALKQIIRVAPSYSPEATPEDFFGETNTDDVFMCGFDQGLWEAAEIAYE